MKSVILLCLLIGIASARKGFGPTDQEWGYVDVRDGAHMFWWLHYTEAEVDNPLDRPLVIWLQGGPGAASTGYGNFAEIGPLDADLKPRLTTWVNNVNLLFVDNPVGTGFSYVDSYDLLAQTNRQIADDFLELMKGFYKDLPKFINVPVYIMSESYGGKMTAEIALVLQEAVSKGDIKCNLKGIGLGDSWVSPVDSVLTWAPYLLHIAAVDQNGYKQVQDLADSAKRAVDAGDFQKAYFIWEATEQAVLDVTSGIDFYNVLTKIPSFLRPVKRAFFKPSLRDDVDEKIDKIMNNQVKEALNLNQTFDSDLVFQTLQNDFMKPVTDIVEELLNSTSKDLKIFVYNGQLDLIVDTLGTLHWVDNLKWPGSAKWAEANREGFSVDGYLEGYVKNVDNLSFYWVNRAGHMVPLDNPAAMEFILKQITDDYSVKKNNIN